MASIGSLGFFIEATSSHNDNAVFLFQGRQNCWSRSRFTQLDVKLRSWRVGIRQNMNLTSRRLYIQAKASKGAGNHGEDEEEDTAALRDTIEKSKKVQSMQQRLLQQAAERRKIFSSIKDSALNAQNGTASFTDDSFPSSESSLPGNQSSERCSGRIAFESSVKVATLDAGNDVELTSGVEDAETRFKTEIPAVDGDQLSKDSSLEETRDVLESTVGETLEEDSGDLKPSNSVLVAESTGNKPPILPRVSSTFVVEEDILEDVPQVKTNEGSLEQDVGPEEETAPPPPLAGVNVMNVILVAAECAPWSKTGGLGDVAGSLPKALARRGHRVMVVAPRYGDYSEPQDLGVRKRYKVDGQDIEVAYYNAYIDGVDFVFVDGPMFRHRENNIYGGKRTDILKRMVLFCKAAVEVPWHVPCGGICYGDGNLVFIANDWHTALLPVYLKAYYRDNGLMKYTRSVLVIHNIAHQGRGPVTDFSFTDLPEHYLECFRLYDPLGGEHFNIFAGGLKTADRVVTVSHGYAWELKTQEGGWGLHNIINENDWKFQGIVNGVDTKDWNPALDVHLQSDGYTNYSLETLKTGKAQCKEALQKELGLPVRPEVPIIGFIGRLDYQKGVDLIGEAMPWIVSQDVQVVMLGTGRPDLEEMLRRFEREHNDKVRGWVGFSVRTAHRITAGVDILMMPSRFEPCGLNQLYAMMYGTIPVVHAVGGLRDTVVQFNPFEETGYGWTFDRAEANRLIDALRNCLETYWNYKKSWEGLQTRGMTQDLSWDKAAQRYEEVLVAAKYQW